MTATGAPASHLRLGKPAPGNEISALHLRVALIGAVRRERLRADALISSRSDSCAQIAA